MDKKIRMHQILKDFTRIVILPIIYKIYSLKNRNIRKGFAVLADAHHRELPEDMRLIKEQLNIRGIQTKEVVSDFQTDGIWTNTRNMIRFMKFYTMAEYVFLCNYYLPVVSVPKKTETKVVQLWHACGAFKRFGYDAIDDMGGSAGKDLFQNFDLVTVSAEKCIPIYANAFHIAKEKVQALGISRTDYFFKPEFQKECREEFLRLHPEADGKKILLWAPTFRNHAGAAQVIGDKEITALAHKLQSDWYVIKKIHPHADGEGTVSNSVIKTERLYPVADLLVTDYSSVIFEFALLKKPMILYAPDLKAYKADRGFYIDLNEIPAIVTERADELERLITSGEYMAEQSRYHIFISNYLEMCDGHATERIIDYIIQ